MLGALQEHLGHAAGVATLCGVASCYEESAIVAVVSTRLRLSRPSDGSANRW